MDGSKPNHQTEDATKTTQEIFNSEFSSGRNSLFQTSQVQKQESSTTKRTTFKRLNGNNKVINLLDPVKRSRKNKTRKALNKSSQNETTEEEDVKKTMPSLRHRKNHHHGRQSRGRNASARTKKDKVNSRSFLF